MKVCKICGTSTPPSWHGKKCQPCHNNWKKNKYKTDTQFSSKIKEASKQYRKDNVDKVRQSELKRSKTEHRRQQTNAIQRNRKRIRRREDIRFRTINRISALIRYHIKRLTLTKKEHVLDILGAPVDQVVWHLETTFLFNYNKPYEGEDVHIDHIVPMNSASSLEDVRRLNHYTNLQYLLPVDNIRKKDKTTYVISELPVTL